jgi:hypothetical protein
VPMGPGMPNSPPLSRMAAVGGARLRLHRLDEAVRHGAGGGGPGERLHAESHAQGRRRCRLRL